jgi:hypothetical protein
VLSDPDYGRDLQSTGGWRWPEVVNLLQTFATQSALAIQNARLFREIEEKTHALKRRAFGNSARMSKS